MCDGQNSTNIHQCTWNFSDIVPWKRKYGGKGLTSQVSIVRKKKKIAWLELLQSQGLTWIGFVSRSVINMQFFASTHQNCSTFQIDFFIWAAKRPALNETIWETFCCTIYHFLQCSPQNRLTIALAFLLIVEWKRACFSKKVEAHRLGSTLLQVWSFPYFG